MVNAKQIRIVTLLVIDIIFFFIEVIVGYAVHSLALIADSFHMLNDIISLVVALWAVKVATTKGADARYTYGWKRAEILGALINAVFLIALCFSIFIEAIQRFISPAVITNPKLILYVGSAGLVSNIVGLFLFHDHGHSHGGSGGHSHSHGVPLIDDEPVLPEDVVNSYTEQTSLLPKKLKSPYSTEPEVSNEYHATLNGDLEGGHSHSHSEEEEHNNHEHTHNEIETKAPKKTKSMNMEGVFLHVLGDALGNVGVIFTALFIWKTDYTWRFYADPFISLVITAIIFSSALPLCRRASRILLQATPSTISAEDVQEEVVKVQGVKSVHDFHIWNLTEDIFIASLHIEVDANPEAFLVIASEIRSVLHNYGIHSATVQPEFISKDHISAEVYQQFTKIASGKYASRSNSVQNLHKAIDDSQNGGEQCIVDSAVNCNTENCLDPNK
jgi:zinc transporter 1